VDVVTKDIARGLAIFFLGGIFDITFFIVITIDNEWRTSEGNFDRIFVLCYKEYL
jgi:hypothetical protein